MVMKQRGCAATLTIDESVDNKITDLCRKILEEHTLIAAAGFPRDMRDLFVEQCKFNKFNLQYYSK